jgi:NitT/TauT family transport system substrate-binding protein
VQLVAAGKTDIAHVASPAVLTATAQGAKLKMIASFVQVLGSGVMTKPEIKTVKDMCGKTYVGFNFDITTTLFPTYLKAAGVDPGCVKQELSTLGNPTQAYANGADMVAALGWSEIPPAKVLGLKFNFFPYAKAGLNFLGPGLVVNSDWLGKPTNLKTATAFALASARGWQYAEQHPLEAANIVSKAEKTLNKSWTAAIVRVMPGFNYTVRTRGGPLGRLNVLDMQDSVRSAVNTGLIKEAIPAAPLVQNVIPLRSPYKVNRRPEIKGT